MRAPHLTNDDDTVTELPYKFEICSCCRGHGKSSAYLGAYTQDDMDQQGPDFFDDYMSGVYDRQCDSCEGDGKVKVADYSRMTPAQIARLEEADRFDAEFEAEREAERRMGC